MKQADKLTHVTIDEWAKNQNADKAIQQASTFLNGYCVYDDENARNAIKTSVKSVYIPNS